MSVTFSARKDEEEFIWHPQCGFWEKICTSYPEAVAAWESHGKGLCQPAVEFFDRVDKLPEKDRTLAILEQTAKSPYGHDPDVCADGPFMDSYILWENPLREKKSSNDFDAAMADHLDELHERLRHGVSMSDTYAHVVFEALGIKEAPLTDSEGDITVDGEFVYDFSVADSKYNDWASVEDAWNPVLRELNPGFVARTVPEMPYSGTVPAQEFLNLCEAVPQRYGHDHGTLTEEFKGARGATVIANGRPEGYVDRKVEELSELAVFAAAIGGFISWS